MRLNLLTGQWENDTKKPSKRKLPEREVENKIDLYLKSLGFYMRVIKSDGRKLPNGKWIPSRQGRGISDRIGVMPDGRFIAVEIKAEGKCNTASYEQIDFLKNIIRMNGVGVVADSVDKVKAALSMNKDELLNFLPKIKTESAPENLEPLF